MTPVAEQRKIWLNKPQKKSLLINAQEEYGVWGRATGKTDGPIAHRTSHQATVMPRGTTGLIAATYMQHLDRTLPPLFKSWEAMGYVKDKHFWIRSRPNKKLGIPDPIYKVMDPSHYIFWYTGHVFYLISQDRPGLANAKSLDAIVADEARFLNFEQYTSDIVQANRGNDNLFGHMSEHHSVTMFTDMPTKQSAKWILDKVDQVDSQKIKQVIAIQIDYNKLYLEYNNPKTSKPRQNYLRTKMVRYYKALNELRKGLVWYSEASALENIQILGPEKFKQWERELPKIVYETSILNLRNVGIPDGFFHMLDQEYHGYYNYNYNHIDSLGLYLPDGVITDCRKDGDLDPNTPLDIALDYNAAIKSLVVGQDKEKFYPTIKSMYVLAENKEVLTDLIDNFCEYYKPHKCKIVNYFYDHTAKGTDATRLETLADVVTNQLRKHNWQVNRFDIGQQPEHDIRYRLWEEVFSERNRRFKPARFNVDNAEQLLISMSQTGVKKVGDKFKKNKLTEKRNTVRPQDAPHLGDAWETLYIGKFRCDYGYEIAIPEMITI